MYASLILLKTGKRVRGGGRLRRMGVVQLGHKYADIISLENLLSAWSEFHRGKKKKRDVQVFSYRLTDNIVQIMSELARKEYLHGLYHAFNISDPKPRNIHTASVKDRLLHHAIYRVLYPFFDKTFIADSYSCRVGKGTYKALERFQYFFRKVSKNNTRTCWVLKGDIRKFFASIDQKILFGILHKYIPDKDIVCLLKKVVQSFSSTGPGKGLPLGNLTSQLLVNIYMNEFDQWVKHKLKAKYYIRYADDFVIVGENKEYLQSLVPQITDFLGERLKLSLHPNKVHIKTLFSGVDFLGWIHFPHHRVLRTVTKRKIFKRVTKNARPETVQSYLGLLKHGNSSKLISKIDALRKQW